MADAVQTIDHKSAVDLWLSSKKLIFFCGSGVSQFSPTCLPTGWTLVRTCYKSLESQLRKAGHKNVRLDDLSRLPLETLLEFVVEDVTTSKYKEKVTNIAAYFQNAPANRLHFLISNLINKRHNCHIITTNYDSGFEKALEEIRSSDTLNHQKSPPVKVLGAEALGNIQLDESNFIFKIHGCASLDRPENLILTTRQESSGLPQSFLSILQELFEDSLVVFLGYSLSEPDCLEALMSVSKFDVIWADRNFETFKNNFRAQIIIGEARKAYFLENIIPFIELPLQDIHPKLFGRGAGKLDDPNLRTPFSTTREEQERSGIKLFEELTTLSNEEELIRAVILGYSQLREFQKVQEYLDEYKNLKNYSQFDYYMWKASIIRDKNWNWKKACDYFELASNINGISALERSTAQSMQFGLESLIFQADNYQLKNLQTRLISLIDSAKHQLNLCPPTDRLEWLSILGRTQKNLVQNLSYQSPLTVDLLDESLRICDEAIHNLNEAQDIHGRIETERLKARVHFRIYKTIGEKQQLEAALNSSEKTLRLFSLLSGSMGIINAKRQYALMLIEAKKFEAADKEIKDLNNLLSESPDNLSRIKVTALETYLYFRTTLLHK